MLCFEVFNVLNNLRSKLRQRIEDKFVSFHCNNLLKMFPRAKQQSLMNTFLTFYNNILTYIEQRFDFTQNNYLQKFQVFSQKSEVTFSAITEVVQSTCLKNFIDFDELYDEFCEIRDALSLAVQSDGLTALDKWAAIFKANPAIKNFLKIFEFIASIPASNAEAERIFSLCENVWTDYRNRLTVDHVKSELQVKVNFAHTCKEFYYYALQNKKLLQAAKSQNKHVFKNKNQN